MEKIECTKGHKKNCWVQLEEPKVLYCLECYMDLVKIGFDKAFDKIIW